MPALRVASASCYADTLQQGLLVPWQLQAPSPAPFAEDCMTADTHTNRCMLRLPQDERSLRTERCPLSAGSSPAD